MVLKKDTSKLSCRAYDNKLKTFYGPFINFPKQNSLGSIYANKWSQMNQSKQSIIWITCNHYTFFCHLSNLLFYFSYIFMIILLKLGFFSSDMKILHQDSSSFRYKGLLLSGKIWYAILFRSLYLDVKINTRFM